MARRAKKMSQAIIEGPHKKRLAAIARAGADWKWSYKPFKTCPEVKAVLSLDRTSQREVLFALFREIGLEPARSDLPRREPTYWWNFHHDRHAFNAFCVTAALMLRRDHNLTLDDWLIILRDVGKFPFISFGLSHQYVNPLLSSIERDAKKWDSIPKPLQSAMKRVAFAFGRCSSNVPQQKASERLLTILRRFEARSALQGRTSASSPSASAKPPKPARKVSAQRRPEIDAATRKRHAALINAIEKVAYAGDWSTPEFRDRSEIQEVLELPAEERPAMLLSLFDELGTAAGQVKENGNDITAWSNFHSYRFKRANASGRAIEWMLQEPPGLEQSEWVRILRNLARFRVIWMAFSHSYLPATFDALTRDADAWLALDPETATLIQRVRSSIVDHCSDDKRHIMLGEKLLSVLHRFTGKQTSGDASQLPQLPTAPPPVRSEIASLLSSLRQEVVDMEVFRGHVFGGCPSFATLCALPDDRFPELVRQATARHDELVGPDGMSNTGGWSTNPGCRERLALLEIIYAHLPKAVEGQPDILAFLCVWLIAQKNWAQAFDRIEDGLLKAVEKHAKSHDLTPPMTAWVMGARERWNKYPKTFASKIKRSGPLVSDELIIDLDPGEPWAAQVLADVADAAPAARTAWTHLIDHCMGSSGSAPSGKWSSRASELIKTIGKRDFEAAALRWLPLINDPRTTVATSGYYQHPIGSIQLLDRSMNTLRGLCWAVSLAPTPTNTTDIARTLGQVVISAYRKIPGRGPRAILVGNAAIHALGQMKGPDALGQLAMLRVKVKFGTGQKMLEKALNAAATREGLPRDEIEELAVPSYAMTDVGLRREEIGEYIAELRILAGGTPDLSFTKQSNDAKGKPPKPQKSVPASIKSDFADDLKELKAASKDIASMLPAQRDRIDSLFVENKTWPLATWRERYLDHPLVGTIARRLIWTFTPPQGSKASPAHAVWLDEAGSLVTVDGKPFTPPEGGTVSLWHPINHSTDDIIAWRRFFEDRQIRQPFKQAHREVYILTDAERNTGTYSNRYAAHIIRQHQFNALCGARHWKNKLRLMVDAEYPPATRHLRAFGLRAEFWVEGAGDNYGVHTNEAGTFHFLATDQVRFYHENAAQGTAHASGGGAYVRDAGEPDNPLNEPLPLNQIPALAFSEIMRDVDLFVGVGSIGNNPQWADGGPTNEHRDYWWHFSFGEMSESGKTRRDILSRLVPRLKIAPVSTLSEQFLVVKGKLRTYKIHLGSGNILMEPNDQYLCIVPSSRDETSFGASGGPGVFLPFEGDRTLSIILSKAFMLAADDTIADPSIRSQIARK